MKVDVVRIIDPKSHSTAPRRFAHGAAWGVVMVLGMWLISTLQHAQDYKMGLTWQVAVAGILLMGLIALPFPSKKKA
jgi:hypothetical protein